MGADFSSPFEGENKSDGQEGQQLTEEVLRNMMYIWVAEGFGSFFYDNPQVEDIFDYLCHDVDGSLREACKNRLSSLYLEIAEQLGVTTTVWDKLDEAQQQDVINLMNEFQSLPTPWQEEEMERFIAQLRDLTQIKPESILEDKISGILDAMAFKINMNRATPEQEDTIDEFFADFFLDIKFSDNVEQKEQFLATISDFNQDI